MSPALLPLFEFGEQPLQLVTGSYNWGLISLSFFAALLGTYTLLLTLSRAITYKAGRKREVWLFTSACIAGIAIWSMHFIGMLAFCIPLAISHDVYTSLFAIVPTIIANRIAFGIKLTPREQGKSRNLYSALAGLIFGAGMLAMHYIGIGAIQFSGFITLDMGWFTTSVVLALTLSVFSFVVSLPLINWYRLSRLNRFLSRLLPAIIFAVAISVVYYTSMLATEFHSNEILSDVERSDTWLAYVVGVVLFIVVIIAVTATEVDHRFFEQKQSKLEAEDKVHDLATHDVLTGLPNRRAIVEALLALMEQPSPNQNYCLAVFDLDNFKRLNNNFGSSYGDLLLKKIAYRIKQSVQEAHTIARIDSNEFAILLALPTQGVTSTNQQQCINVVQSIQLALEQPYKLGHYSHLATFSVGLTQIRTQAAPEIALREAKLAVSHAKAEHDNSGIEFFNESFASDAERKLRLAADLSLAITNKQLTLHYQPQVNHQGQVIGAEALLRWQHSIHGRISPDEFIPLAEETGLIIQLGQWVLETACNTLKRWQHDKNYSHLVLSINVSSKQFQQPNFVDDVINTVKAHNIDPQYLMLEITESLLMHNIDKIVEQMHKLREFGINFAMDDFGTGYSSLQYLAKLPFKILKIDISFVRGMLQDPSMASIVRAIIQLAESLNLNLVAEGVETIEQRDYLAQEDCYVYQGYLYSRPLPIAEFMTLLNTVNDEKGFHS